MTPRRRRLRPRLRGERLVAEACELDAVDQPPVVALDEVDGARALAAATIFAAAVFPSTFTSSVLVSPWGPCVWPR